MKFIYDHGTVLIKNTSQEWRPKLNSPLLWDPRVESYRARGRHYSTLLKECRGLTFVDLVKTDLNYPTHAQWKLPDLRPYQSTALQVWQEAGCAGIIVLPTGAGKTILALSAMSEIGSRCLCLVPTRALLEQWQNEIQKYYTGKIGIQGDGVHTLHPVTISTYESAYRNVALYGNQFDLVVVDECHHFGVGIRDEILEMLTARNRLGLTATLPVDSRFMGKINELIGPLVFELSVGDLSGSFLADFDYYTIQVDLTSEERTLYHSEIQLYHAVFSRFKRNVPESNYLDWIRFAGRSEEGRNALASFQKARKMISYCQAKSHLLEVLLAKHWKQKLLIFTADTEVAYRISKQHLIMPITSEIARKERKVMLKNFQEGKIRSLVSCRVLNEGLNVPDAEVAVIMGGSLGEREHIQRIGRILRPSVGKRAVVYEFVCKNTMEVNQSRKRRRTIDTPISFTI